MPKLDLAREPATQKRRAKTQSLQHGLGVLTAQRKDEDRSVPQVGAQAYLGDGDRGVGHVRMANLAAAQDVGQTLADQFTDAKLTLAAAVAHPFGHGASPISGL